MFNKILKSDLYIYLGLFLLAFLIVFTSTLNPFGLNSFDSDTSLYLIIAKGITRGLVPFRDFVDNKGPLTYLISAPGMFLGSFTGVWITQLIFMLISLLFAYKTALFFGNKNIAFWGTVCSFLIFLSFYYEVAGTEEYSLPFMMISLYIFTKYFFTQNDPPFYELIILGFCFAVNIFIRINHFPLWLGFCIVVFFESLVKHKFLQLLKFIMFFFTGILIVAIPILIYLYRNNALFDYIYQNFIIGSSRGFSGFSFKEFVNSFFTIMERNYCFLPLPVYLIWIIKKHEKINICLSAGLLLSFLLTILFLAIVRTSYTHYNMMLTPFLIPAMTFSIKFIFNYFSDIKHKNLFLFLFLCVVFSQSLSTWCWSVYKAVKFDSRKNFISIGKRIDQNTSADDTIIVLGKPYAPYLFTERRSASRYVYQGSGVSYDPDSQSEFLNDMQEKKPKIIVIENQNGRYDFLPEWYAPVYAMIENEYKILSSENGCFLFIRND